MPCFYIVQIEVEDEESARKTLQEMGLDPDRYLVKVGDGFEVQGINQSQERQFRQKYGKNYTVKTARKKFFNFDKEETLADGSIRLTFKSW